MKIMKLLLPFFALLITQTVSAQKMEPVPAELAPPVLFMIDNDVQLTVEQQRERLRIVNTLRPVIRDNKAMLGYTREDVENKGIDGIYYDYMAEITDAYNKILGKLDPEVYDLLMKLTSFACESQYLVENAISIQYLYFDEDMNVVYDLTPELAKSVGMSDEAFGEVNAARLQDKQMVEKFLSEYAEVGNKEDHSRIFEVKGHIFYALSGCGAKECYEPAELEEAFDRINAKYMHK